MSRCPQCRHENPRDAKFCLECGRRLALSCGACGTELPAGAKFCKECGQAVGAAASPIAARVGAPPESYTPTDAGTPGTRRRPRVRPPARVVGRAPGC